MYGIKILEKVNETNKWCFENIDKLANFYQDWERRKENTQLTISGMKQVVSLQILQTWKGQKRKAMNNSRAFLVEQW